jgi:hypothetical protein
VSPNPQTDNHTSRPETPAGVWPKNRRSPPWLDVPNLERPSASKVAPPPADIEPFPVAPPVADSLPTAKFPTPTRDEPTDAIGRATPPPPAPPPTVVRSTAMVPPYLAPPVPMPPPRSDPGRLSPRSVCWVAAHGGAGTTTLAVVVGGVDVGCRWPDPARGEPAQVVLVARTHASGLRMASRALNAVREGRHPAGMTVVGLVLVADAPGRLPRELLRRIKVLRAAVQVWRVPWVIPWRLGRPAESQPSQVKRLSALVQKLESADVRSI